MNFVLVAFAMLLISAPAIATPAIQVWTERETGIQTAGWTALELPDGRMAFGGHSLIIFDGDHWRSYPMGSAYALRALCVDANGTIWSGATNELGYFTPLTDGGYNFTSLKNNLPQDTQSGFSVWSIHKIGSKIAFITNENIFLWNGNHFETWKLHSPFFVRSFATSVGIFIQDKKFGLTILSEEGPRLAISQEKFGGKDVIYVFESEDQLQVVTSGQTWKFKIHEDGTYQQSGSQSNTAPASATHAKVLTNNKIAYSTENAGVLIEPINSEQQEAIRLDERDLLSINHLYQSNDGALWALAREHIARINLDIKIYTELDGLKGGQVTAIGKLGSEIVASNDAGTFKLSHGKFKKINELPELRAWMIRPTATDELAIATTQGTWIHSTQRTFRIRGSSSTFSIEENAGIKFAISNERKIQVADLETESSQSLAETLPDIATSIARDTQDKDTLWVGTVTKGLFLIKSPGDSPQIIRTEPFRGLPQGDYHATVFPVGRILVVACQQQIFFKYPHQQHFSRMSEFSGIVAEISASDEDGRVWLSLRSEGENGLANRIGRLSESNGKLIWEPFDLALYGRNGTPLSILATQNTLLVGTPVGLASYRLSDKLTSPQPKSPILYLRSSALTDDILKKEHRYPYESSQIQISYSSREYASREALRFQTKLVGIDPDWSAPTNESSIAFAGLREGNYEFMVRSTIDGFPSEPASVKFTILPPWWRTKSAYTAYALGLVSAVIAGVRLRERNHKRRTDLLKSMVDQRTEQLLRANEAKTDFLTAMSHDVRTPINGIIGSTLELTRSPLNPDQRELIRRIEVCSGMLGTLVEDVLDFAAIESGQALIADLPFSPQALLESVATVIRANSGDPSRQIAIDIAPELPSQLIGDASRIRQILVNYGSNAIKYGGPEEITLGLSRKDHLFRFSVIDSGPGIPEQDQKKLFSRFSRINPAPGKEGKGLGLAGCRVIARLMNGSVGVQSALGRGSEFWLSIPLHVPAATEANTKDASDVRYNQRALLVEDVTYSAEASRAVLEYLGLNVSISTTGADAIERLKNEPFDVVFLDINLPDQSGTTVAVAIRELEGPGARVRIVATTAHSTTGHKAECIRAGMDGFMSKPLTPEKVHLALARSDMVGEEQSTPCPRISFAMLDFLAKGSAAELEKHANLLINGIDEEMAAIDEGIAKRDREKVKRTAHRMITHARLAGDANLIDLAACLEDIAPSEPFESLDQCACKLKTEIAVIKERLEDHLRRAGSA